MGVFSVTHPHNGLFTGLAILPHQQTVDDPLAQESQLAQGGLACDVDIEDGACSLFMQTLDSVNLLYKP